MHQGRTFEIRPEHPKANVWGYLFRHTLVAEHCLGRHLRDGEVVHHEDENKLNDDPANLWLFPSQSSHLLYHKRDSPRYDQALLERLRPLAADHRVSLVEAGRRLGIDCQTVRAMARFHGVPWVSAAERPLTEAQVRAALRGRSTAEAAEYLGVNHQTLRNRFPHLLSKRASPKTLEAHKEEIRRLAISKTDAEIAPLLGVCSATVSTWILRWARVEDGWSDVLAARRRRGGRAPRKVFSLSRASR